VAPRIQGDASECSRMSVAEFPRRGGVYRLMHRKADEEQEERSNEWSERLCIHC
jgi:hypothetical protein